MSGKILIQRASFFPRVPAWAAYASVLYFFEVIYIMTALLFLYGKGIAILCGFTCAALLSAQILMLYQGVGISRKVQIVLMDIHCAYAASFLCGVAVFGGLSTSFDVFFTAVRALLVLLELPGLYLLTDPRVAELFPS